MEQLFNGGGATCFRQEMLAAQGSELRQVILDESVVERASDGGGGESEQSRHETGQLKISEVAGD